MTYVIYDILLNNGRFCLAARQGRYNRIGWSCLSALSGLVPCLVCILFVLSAFFSFCLVHVLVCPYCHTITLISTMILVGSIMAMSKPAHSNNEIEKMEKAHYNALFNAQLENVSSASQKPKIRSCKTFGCK